MPDGEKTYAVKVISQDDDTVTVGGYGVIFGGVDLEGETFSADTDFMPDLVPVKLVMYDHGLQKAVRHTLGKASETVDKIGIFVTSQLDRHKEYMNGILELVNAEVLGWSSGSVGHLIVRDGKSIKRWPIVEYSLTPTPAEPRTLGVEIIKNLAISNPDLEALLPQDTGDVSSAGATARGASANKVKIGVKSMDEKELQAIKDAAAADALKKDQERRDAEKAALKAEKEKIDAAVSAAKKLWDEKQPAVKEPGVKVTKDELDQPGATDFKSTGLFLQAVKNSVLYPGSTDPKLKALKATGLSENVPADGGYLLAPQVAGGILERMYDTGVLLGMVAADQIGPNSNSMLYNAIDETSRADGSRWGGVQGYWLAEAGTKTASKPTFRQMELKLKKVAALCYATDELLEDATALQSWITRTVPEELKFKVEDAIYNGNGVGKPLGIMNAPCLISPLRVDANQIDETDIANMWARRWAGASDYVWLANPSIFPQLINLTIGNFPALLPASAGMQGDPSFSLYGRPFIEVEYTAALGTTGDLMLASLSQYQTIQKGGVQAASSIHVNFTADETAFRFVYRIDGQPLWNSALTPKDAGNTLSPFVVLSAATV